MTFLRHNYIDKTFQLAKSRQVECVLNQFLFCGPLGLKGIGPFSIENLTMVEARFKDIKKNL